MKFKCAVCGHDGFWVVRQLDSVNGEFFEVWECLECCALYKVYFKLEKIVNPVDGEEVTDRESP